MKLSNIVRLYRVRLRSRLAQELFALSGIAVGVALLFASQVASTSLTGSVREVTRGIVGNMRFQLAARSPEGFDAHVLRDVQRLPGVSVAVPVVQLRVNVVGPSGARTVELLGADPAQAYLAGPLVRRFRYARLTGLRALALPAPIAESIGATSLRPVVLQVGGNQVRALLGITLSSEDAGGLAQSPIALGPLRYVQRLTHMQGRVTSIFVRPHAGEEREVSAGLRRLASAGSLNLRPADFEATLFSQAASPTNQSTLLFSVISALVGFLFAFNAILLTVPQRRDLVEDLRLDGYTASMIVRILLFDALVLGLLGLLVGLALGELLSVEVFRANPGYLSLGFPVGSQRIVGWHSVAIAIAGGMLAALVGILAPLRREVFSPLPGAFVPSARRTGNVVVALIAGSACLAVTSAILLLAPQDAILGIVSLIVALVLLLPPALAGVVALYGRFVRLLSGASPVLALIELRSSANRPRALAIGATGAIAVFGSVAIQGAHSNLQRGLDRLVHQLNTNAQLWVIPRGGDNLLATAPFHGVYVATLRRVSGVASVEAVQGDLLDDRDRRLWVIGMPPGARVPIPPSQMVRGDLPRAAERVRAGGWAAVSRAIADEHHLHIGSSLRLPSPHPRTLRVAALITNLGWPPGSVIMSSADYVSAWASADPSAYYVKLTPGASLLRTRAALARALGSRKGLVVETSRVREQRQRSASRQGLARLTQISWLVLIAAVLAMGAAMGSMIWQRRIQLADLKVDGFAMGELWRALLLESVLLLGTGCLLGALFGVYGQVLLSHALATVTGFPVVFSANAPTAIWCVLMVTTVAVAIVAVPGHAAARARPAISFQE